MAQLEMYSDGHPTEFFRTSNFFVRQLLRVKISKPEIFRPIKFFPAKNSVSAKRSTSETCRFWVSFLHDKAGKFSR